MDDELPLTALAKPKKSSYDDDLPLANLASMGAAKMKGRPSAGKPAAAAGQKAKPVKKGDSSSTSSDSSSSGSSDSSSDSGGKKKAVNKKKRLRLIQKKKAAEEEDDNADNKIKKKDRSPKELVVVDLLIRWWYAMPDWPPADPAFYDAELEKKSLRRVSIQEWEWVPEIDDKGKHKVYELSQFKGVFRKADGEMVDIRPMDTCPSFNNFMRKDLPELYSMLVKAYEGQLAELKKSEYDESANEAIVSNGLTRIRHKAQQANEMAFARGAVAKKQKTE